MTLRTTIIAVAVAGLLALAAYLSIRTPAGPAQPQQTGAGLLTFDPARVIAVERHDPSGATERLARDATGSPTGWTLAWDGLGDGRTTWPASEARVRAGLRTLATAAVDDAPDADVQEDGVRLRLELQDGTNIALHFGADALGGRIPVRIERESEGSTTATRTVLAEASLAEAFARTGLLPWRDDRLLPRLGAGPRRVEIEAGAGSLVIHRAQRGWALSRPVDARASSDATERLLGLTAQLRAHAFADGAATERDATGLDSPTATVTLETERRLADGDEVRSETIVQTLTVGRLADVAGRRRYAEARLGPFGPVLVTLDAESLAGITARPEAYLSPRTLDIPAGDIVEIVFAWPGDAPELRLRRELGQWRGHTAEERADLAPADRERLEALLALLTERDASAIVLDTPAAEPIAIVTLSPPGGGTIATLPIWRADTGEGVPTGLDVGADRITRRYEGDRPGAVAAWLEGLAPRAEPSDD